MGLINTTCAVCQTPSGVKAPDELRREGWIQRQAETFLGTEWVCGRCAGEIVAVQHALVALAAEAAEAERERYDLETVERFEALMGGLRDARWIPEETRGEAMRVAHVARRKVEAGYRSGLTQRDGVLTGPSGEPGQL